MRIAKKLLALLPLLSISTSPPSANDPFALLSDKPVNRAVDDSSIFSFHQASPYTNILSNTDLKQNGSSIRARFDHLKYGMMYNIVFRFGAKPYSEHLGFSLKADFDDYRGNRDSSQLTLSSYPNAKVTEDKGYLSCVYINGDWCFSYTPPYSYGGSVSIEAYVSNTQSVLSRFSAYQGDEARGIIPYKGTVNPNRVTFKVQANNRVNIQASPLVPVQPGELLDGLIAYDDYDQEWIRPEPDGDSLDRYAELLGRGFEVGDAPVIRFIATDKSNNSSKISVVINYMDLQAPKISFPDVDGDVISISYTQAENSEKAHAAVLAKASVEDDLREDITPTVEIMDFKPLTLGTYPFKVVATDGYNSTISNGYLEIFDDVAPRVDGPSVITTSVSSPLTPQGIIDMFDIEDAIDGDDLTVSLENNTYHKGSNCVKVGYYSFDLVVVDKSGNRTTESVSVEVKDIDGPVWYLYGSNLVVQKGTKVTPMQMVQQLVQEGVIDDLDYVRASIAQGQEVDGTHDVGTHKLIVKAETMDGTARYAGITLTVLSPESLGVDDNPLVRRNGFVQFFVDIWESIVNFFKKLFGKQV